MGEREDKQNLNMSDHNQQQQIPDMLHLTITFHQSSPMMLFNYGFILSSKMHIGTQGATLTHPEDWVL